MMRANYEEPEVPEHKRRRRTLMFLLVLLGVPLVMLLAVVFVAI